MKAGKPDGKDLFFSSAPVRISGLSLKFLLLVLIGMAVILPCPGQENPHAKQPQKSPGFFEKIIRLLPFQGDENAAVRPRIATPLAKLTPPLRNARIADDLAAAQRYRLKMLAVLEYLCAHPDALQPAAEANPMAISATGDPAAPAAWQRFLDYGLALDSLAQYHHDFMDLKGPARAASFRVFRTALTAQYRTSLEWFEVTRTNSALAEPLNRPLPELGLPTGSFTHFQDRFLNPERDAELAALEVTAKSLNSTRLSVGLNETIAADLARLRALGKGLATPPAPKAALALLRADHAQGWFSHTVPPEFLLISPQQIELLLARLDPGDVLLVRRESQPGNIGLPGYWTHAALYIGAPAERAGFFNESDVKAWACEQGFDDFESMLKALAPQAYEQGLAPREVNRPTRVIEAVGTGVGFSALESAAAADYVAVLRPTLAKRDKACALLHAFQLIGRPYDHDYDFSADSALMCSELITRAFTADRGARGLHFGLTMLLGRPVLSPNDIARQFTASHGAPGQQFEFVLYLNGRAPERQAEESGLEEFCKSWQKPKWNLIAAPPQLQNGLAWEVKPVSKP